MSNVPTVSILIQTVGTGGPDNPVWEAMAFVVRQRRPQLLVQWCSEETLERTVPKFDAALGEGNRPNDVRRTACRDPNDVDELARQYAQQIDQLRAEFPDARIEVDFTSGTKPMSAAAVAAAVARRLPYLHYAVGPRDEGGRVVQTDSVVTLDTGQVVADRLLGELGRLFDQGQFTSVRTQATALAAELTDDLLRARAESLAFLADVYEQWDRFAWADASRLLHGSSRQQAMPSLTAAGWDTAALLAQKPHLDKCKEGNVRPQRLADLLANTARRIGQGRYDDAVARLYRLIEYIAQVRFRVRFKIGGPENPTHRVPLPGLAAHAPRLAAELQQRKASAEDRVNLGLRDTIEALAEAGDPVGASLKARYDPPDPSQPGLKGRLGQFLDARNQSLLAHGSEPVSESVAREFYEVVQTILADHFTADGLNLTDLLHVAQFLRCPWGGDPTAL